MCLLTLTEVAGLTLILGLVVTVGALVPLNSDVVETGLVHRKGAALLRLVVAVGALFPLYADVVLVGLVRRYVAVRLGPVLAVLVVTEPPEHVNIVHYGSVFLLRLVLAPKLSTSMP